MIEPNHPGATGLGEELSMSLQVVTTRGLSLLRRHSCIAIALKKRVSFASSQNK